MQRSAEGTVSERSRRALRAGGNMAGWRGAAACRKSPAGSAPRSAGEEMVVRRECARWRSATARQRDTGAQSPARQLPRLFARACRQPPSAARLSSGECSAQCHPRKAGARREAATGIGEAECCR